MSIQNVLCSGLQAINNQASSGSKLEENQALLTILLIEDCPRQIEIIKLMLQPLPCKIVTVLSAEEGSKYLNSSFKIVDLILSDIDLPRISGLDFLRKIKQKNRFKEIPVILQSGCGAAEEQRGLKLKAAAFVRKPYKKRNLYAAIYKTKVFNDEFQQNVLKKHLEQGRV